MAREYSDDDDDYADGGMKGGRSSKTVSPILNRALLFKLEYVLLEELQVEQKNHCTSFKIPATAPGNLGGAEYYLKAPYTVAL